MANKIYYAPETAIRFKDTDATYTLTLNNLAAGTGRIGDRVDRGAGSLPAEYGWRACFQFETAPVVGESVEVLVAGSDGTVADGNVGTTDAALTAGPASNLDVVGIVRVQTTDVDTNNIASGTFMLKDRYFSIGVFNRTADGLAAHNDVSWVEVWPVPPEIQ